MKFVLKDDYENLILDMRAKAKKKHILIDKKANKIKIYVDPNSQLPEEQRFPVIFKGKVKSKDGESVIKGRFTYGFNFYTLIIIAIVLIAARLVASIMQKQIDNIVLCLIAIALLLVVITMILVRTSNIKDLIKNMLREYAE